MITSLSHVFGMSLHLPWGTCSFWTGNRPLAQRGTSRHFPGLSRIILAAVLGSPDSNWFGMEQDRWIQVVFKNMCPCALIWTTRDWRNHTSISAFVISLPIFGVLDPNLPMPPVVAMVPHRLKHAGECLGKWWHPTSLYVSMNEG